MSKWFVFLWLGGGALLIAQSTEQPQQPQAPEGLKQPAEVLKQRGEAPPGSYQVDAGTHILLSIVNSVSTKQAQPGDRIYLETAFPVTSGNRIVIPQGSYVTGTITEVKRPGRVKGRGEMQVRFDSLVLPNGVSRNFRSGLGGLDGTDDAKLNKEQDKVVGPGGKGRDAIAVAGGGLAGAGLGSTIGLSRGAPGKGAGIGGAAGAAAGLLGVMLTRGPDAILPRGSTVEMVLDRSLIFNQDDLDFSNAPPHAALIQSTPPAQKRNRLPF
jgi:hypothetical protein